MTSIEPKKYIANPTLLMARHYTGKHQSLFTRKYYTTYNNFGSRNLFEVEDTEEDERIVLLGDSYFNGAGLNDNETISYFLNKIDNKNKYINLALVGANINDSVAYYFVKWEGMANPKAIVFQILWGNDICASSFIQEKVERIIAKDYKYLLPPFCNIFTKKILLRYYLSQIYAKINQNLTEDRFLKYFINPLSRLAQTKNKIVIITFGFAEHNRNYEEKLKKYCSRNDIYFYRIEDILENKYLMSRISKNDHHPNSEFNKQLAFKISSLLEDDVFKH